MSVIHLLAAPAAEHVLAAGGYELGTGRTVPTAAALAGLISVVAGGVARARSRRAGGSGPSTAIVALALGVLSVAVGGLHGANAAGGLGTGNGVAGAIFALVLGSIGVALGWLVLARARTVRSRE